MAAASREGGRKGGREGGTEGGREGRRVRRREGRKGRREGRTMRLDLTDDLATPVLAAFHGEGNDGVGLVVILMGIMVR